VLNKISVLMVLSLILGLMIPLIVFGEEVPDGQLEQAIVSVKQKLDIEDVYDKFNARVNSLEDSTEYYLSWSDSKEKLPLIEVATDANGEIISYNLYLNETEKPDSRLPKYSREEVDKLAREFIKKVRQNAFGQIRLQDEGYTNIQNDYYNLEYIRIVDGIEFKDNSININISKFNSSISSYYSNWDEELVFPDKTNILTLEEAEQAFKEKIGLDILYKSPRRYLRPIDTGDNKDKYYLVYTIQGQIHSIDAKTGEPFQNGYNEIYGMGANEATKESSDSAEITPQEREEIDKFKNLISLEMADQKSRELLSLEKDVKLKSNRLNESWKNPEGYIYSLYYEYNMGKDKTEYIEVQIDAITKELLGFYRSYPIDYTKSPKLSREQALNKANAYLKKVDNDKVDFIELRDENIIDDNTETFYFQFDRKIGDIYIEGDAIVVVIDAINDRIMSYNSEWYRGEFSSSEGLISIDKAYEILFNNIGYSLEYKKETIYEAGMLVDEKIRLVYEINQDKPSIIDAKTGEIIDYSGEPYIKKAEINYTDIYDSYAKDQISLLAENGIGFSGEMFRPKIKIIQEDYLYLLWKANNSYRTENENNMDIIYEELIASGVLDKEEESRKSIVTKEAAAKYAIRSIGYREVAEIENIYKDVFLDSKEIATENKGYVNIAYGLKILLGNYTNNINPKYELNREDAATIIYNIIFK